MSLSNLIANAQLNDSIAGKAYCAFYLSSCSGITLWMIVVDNISSYSIYYTDSYPMSKLCAYKNGNLPKDEETMQQLFALEKFDYKYNQQVEDDDYTPWLYYFTICDSNHEVLLEWDQSTTLLHEDVDSPDKIFIPICLSFLLPELY